MAVTSVWGSSHPRLCKVAPTLSGRSVFLVGLLLAAIGVDVGVAIVVDVVGVGWFIVVVSMVALVGVGAAIVVDVCVVGSLYSHLRLARNFLLY